MKQQINEHKLELFFFFLLTLIKIVIIFQVSNQNALNIRKNKIVDKMGK